MVSASLGGGGGGQVGGSCRRPGLQQGGAGRFTYEQGGQECQRDARGDVPEEDDLVAVLPQGQCDGFGQAAEGGRDQGVRQSHAERAHLGGEHLGLDEGGQGGVSAGEGQGDGH